MRLQTVFVAFLGAASASIPAKLAQRHSDVGIQERQAYPYPAYTIDQIVRSHFLHSLFLFYLYHLQGNGGVLTLGIREDRSFPLFAALRTTPKGDIQAAVLLRFHVL